jgi:hypothetical protein
MPGWGYVDIISGLGVLAGDMILTVTDLTRGFWGMIIQYIIGNEVFWMEEKFQYFR